VSRLSFKETAELIAEYKAIAQPKVDYSRYTEAQIAAMNAALRVENKCLGFTFTKPFHQFSFEQFDFLLACYNDWSKWGHYPYPGKLADQPSKLIECLQVLKALQHEESEQERKKQEQIQKRKR